ncbi:hypothetical protein OGAPHI_000721 [Ogataea philodendri]|uniref:GID complex catalytic subunit 2 n=1 Tax=Ogataea philodendri TaxID=1378263 RepID=A0A9P8PG54_9ASCO|nr:uncharacterized protein OGAPHI_000721 [Ogataea philodendri]KAH3671010.1 hypothetical protein OGAPHI_000721 [Ogataea philodendri]
MSSSFKSLSEEIDKLSGNRSLENIVTDSDSLLAGLETLKHNIENDNDDLTSTKAQVKSWTDKTLKNEKSINKAIKSYSAKIEKLASFKLANVYSYQSIEVKDNPRNRKLLDRAIVMDLLRNGHFDIVERIESERDIPIPPELIAKFKELDDILVSLREHDDLRPAIEWASRNSDKLKAIRSDLEFDLHKLQFIKLYRNSKKSEPFEAYKYAKDNFPNFGATHLDTISKLLFSIMYSSAASGHGFESYLTDLNLSNDSFYNQICQNYCSLIGLSANSPLYSTLLTSYIALPNFIKYHKISKLSNNLNWTSTNEIPFEINLPASLQFHSIFICPVSKEETTPENPPMVLPCHHIISKESLLKLSRNSVANFKCPYCPGTSTITQAVQAKFINL